jgi:hypothetical protein
MFRDAEHCIRYTPVAPALGRLSLKDLEFEASLGYTAKPCLKQTNKGMHSTERRRR